MSYKLGKRGEKDLFEFSVRSDAKVVAAAMRQAGMQINATQFQKTQDKVGLAAINGMTRGAKAIAVAHVPFDTEVFRNKHIHFSKGRVYIDAKDHLPNSNRRRQPEEAAALGIYLDNPDREPHNRTYGRGRRYRGTEPTRFWIAESQILFQNRQKQILASAIAKARTD